MSPFEKEQINGVMPGEGRGVQKKRCFLTLRDIVVYLYAVRNDPE